MNPPRRWAAWTLLATVLTAISLARAFPATFTHLSFWDDTGYMLAIVRDFAAGGGLYTRVFSQYGPWYAEFYALLYRVLGVPATQDSIRWISVAAWLAGSVAAGGFAFRLTGRLLVAALVQVVAFLAMAALSVDAGHPISLCVLCVAAAMSLVGSGGKWGMVGCGAALGALGLVKINLGVFAVAAVGTAWAFGTPGGRVGRLLRWGAGGLLCVLPLLLVRGSWPRPAQIHFLTVVLASLLGVVTALGSGESTPASWRESLRLGLALLAGWTAVWIAGIGAIILTGTRPADVLDGMLLRPLGLSSVFSVEPHVYTASFLAALVGLSGAMSWRFVLPALARRYGAAWLERGESVLRWGFLALMLGGTLAGRVTTPLLPFLWIGLLPPRNSAPDMVNPFVRRALPLLAVTEFLSLYPVAGVQSILISYLEVFVAVLVAAAVLPHPQAQRRTPARWRLAFGAAALATTAAFAWQTVVAWSARSRTVPFALPGSTLVRDDEWTVAGYEFLAANLAGQRSFVTLPGINSLYPWAHVPYPAGPNCTENFALLTPAEQRVLTEVGRRSEPVAMVYRQDLYDWWVQHHAPANSVLADFLRQECRPVGQVQAFTLLRHSKAEPSSSLRWTFCASAEQRHEEDAEQFTGRISVRVPPSFQPAGAVLLDADGALTSLLPLRPPAEPLGDWTLTVPDIAVLRTHQPARLCLRLCDAAGRRLTTVPFFVPAD